MTRKSLYDETAPSVKTTSGLFNGTFTGLLNLNSVKYTWAYNLYKHMLANTWFPTEVSMGSDMKDYKSMPKEYKLMYDRVLGHLIFLDSIQQNNIVDNINPYITAPEINMCLIRQASEESLHAHSYAVMIDTISEDTSYIYDLWKTDKKLAEKARTVSSKYQSLGEDLSNEHSEEYAWASLALAAVSNVILEGIYFYSGFTCMYLLAMNNVMVGSSNMIRFIERDEGGSHLNLFTNIFKNLVSESEYGLDLTDEIRVMFDEAIKIEIDWGKYVCGDVFPEFRNETIDKYIKYLANRRFKALGLTKEPLYPEAVENPIPWRDKFSKFNDQRTNFFEARVTNYSKGTLDFSDI